MSPKPQVVDLIADNNFLDIFLALPPAAKVSIGKLLTCLQDNPYDPALQQAALDPSGDRFAYTLPEGYVVYWQVVQSGHSQSITIRLTDIKQL
jgi:hypothetical protein